MEIARTFSAMNFDGFFKNSIGSDDYSLLSMGFAKLVLRSIFMWPESNSSREKKIIYWIAMMICLFVQTGLLLYLIQNFHDYNEILDVVSSMATIFQTAYKVTTLHINSKRIKFVLESMWTEFWPHDLAEGTKEAFKSGYVTRLWMMSFMLTSALLFSLTSIISPIFSNGREFPYKTLFPFDVQGTPFYQMIYFLQIGTHYLINMSVCGFDFLFMGICAGLTNQYILLGRTFEQLGTENMLPMYNKIRKLDGNKRLLGIGQDRKFLKLCMKHHQLLTRRTAVVEQIFNVVAFLQLYSSVLAICVSGFIATKGDVNSTQIATMGSYLIGHFIQLYIYCAVGNELLYQMILKLVQPNNDTSGYFITYSWSLFPLYSQSSSLTHNIFNSNWYDLNCAHSRKDMILIMRKAQIPAKLTAFKVFPLNFATFIAVVRLSFSSYTLLATITKE